MGGPREVASLRMVAVVREAAAAAVMVTVAVVGVAVGAAQAVEAEVVQGAGYRRCWSGAWLT
jgi:hypothetical protein